MLKALSLGTWLDVEVMESLLNPSHKTLGQRWLDWDANGQKTGEGFNLAPGSPQKFVDFLANLPVFQPPTDGFEIDYAALRKYGELFGTNEKGQSCANMPRREALFRPPLVIVPQAPGDDPHAPRAYISRQSVAFSKSYYGYSCDGHPEAETLACLSSSFHTQRCFHTFAS